MKRVGYLFEKIITKENLIKAHFSAAINKMYRSEVRQVHNNLAYYIEKLHNMLNNKEYKPSNYETKEIMCRNKIREISTVPYFPDRIVHHAIMNILEPIWKPTLIKETYQSIKGRGITKCKNDLEYFLRKNENEDLWCLKLDVSKFYPSINNDILKDIIKRKIKCKRTLELIYSIIDKSYGVPIGNYISQYFGNLYLYKVDHTMKSKKECLFYSRYCDDIVMITNNKEECKLLKDTITEELNKLKLGIKKNIQYFDFDKRQIDYVGYVFKRTKQNRKLKITIRKSIKRRFKSACRVCGEEVMASYYGWLKHSNSYQLWNKYYKGDKKYAFKYSKS